MAKAKTKKEVKAKREVKTKNGKAAFVLAVIASAILLFEGLFFALARNLIVNIVAQFGWVISAASLLTNGIILLVLAVLIFITAKRIERTGSRTEKWLLLILSILTIIAEFGLASLLALISAIIYLVKK